jgi:hypothetical protein
MLKVTVNTEFNGEVKAGQVRFNGMYDFYALIVLDEEGNFNAVKLTEGNNSIVKTFEMLYPSGVEAYAIKRDFPTVVDAELTIKGVMN